jgi:hypothetical protein
MKAQMLRLSIAIPLNIAQGSQRKLVPDLPKFVDI